MLSEEEIEEKAHDRWLLIQELGDEYYRLYEKDEDDEKEDPEDMLRRLEWQEEEERAKAEYFKMIEEEEKRGCMRPTTEELIREMCEAEDIEK